MHVLSEEHSYSRVYRCRDIVTEYDLTHNKEVLQRLRPIMDTRVSALGALWRPAVVVPCARAAKQ